MKKISRELVKEKIRYNLSLVIPNLGRYIYFRHYENLSNDEKFQIEPEMFLLPALVNKDGIVFDVGANVGGYCYQLEKLTSARNIFAFEPLAKEYRLLQKLFPYVNLFNIALSNEVGFKTLRIPVLSNGTYLSTRSSLERIVENVDIDHYLEIRVETNTIDNIVASLGLLRIDFIKIDVEGHEFEVLKGASKTLERMRPVLLVEIEQRHHPFAIEVIFDYISSLGYSGFFISRFNKDCLPLENFLFSRSHNSSSAQDMHNVNNFFFVSAGEEEKYLYSVKKILKGLDA